MARIKGITDSEAGAEVRQIFDEQKKRHGFVSNAAQVSAVRPTIQKGVQALAQGIQESGLLAQELRNLVCVRTATIKDRKSTRLNSSHLVISYAVPCMKKQMS